MAMRAIAEEGSAATFEEGFSERSYVPQCARCGAGRAGVRGGRQEVGLDIDQKRFFDQGNQEKSGTGPSVKSCLPGFRLHEDGKIGISPKAVEKLKEKVRKYWDKRQSKTSRDLREQWQTWNHFEHFREAFGKWGLPEIVYTDGLSLFGPSSSNDHSDPVSEFQRAFRGLGVAHRVAPSPQAKGKIERRFGTFQRRLVTLLSHARATTWKQADVILQMEIARQNRTVNRSTGSRPLQFWEEQALSACGRMRPVPPAIPLDLHLSLRWRRVDNAHSIDFAGRNYDISATLRKSVIIVYHPSRQFWVVEHPLTNVWPSALGHFILQPTVLF